MARKIDNACMPWSLVVVPVVVVPVVVVPVVLTLPSAARFIATVRRETFLFNENATSWLQVWIWMGVKVFR